MATDDEYAGRDSGVVATDAHTAGVADGDSASGQTQPTTSSAPAKRSSEVVIDDLTGDGDYWLSITDAARVTRRQEISIRRWIAAGALPVRGQRMGLNKRTRHVRASDLARLTPIIDPTAAITGAPAQVDLLSIPETQAQIRAEHQRLSATFADLEQRARDIADQAERHQGRLTQLQTDVASHSQTTDALLATIHQIEKTISSQSQDLASTSQVQSTLDKRVGALEQQSLATEKKLRALASIEQGLRSAQASMAEITLRLASAEQSVTLLGTRIEAHEDSIRPLATAVKDHSEHLTTVDAELARVQASVKEAHESLRHMRKEEEQRNLSAERAQANMRELIQRMQASMTEATASLAEHAHARHAAEQRASEMERRIAGLEARLEQIEDGPREGISRETSPSNRRRGGTQKDQRA